MFNETEWKLKDNVNFKLVNDKSIMKYNFDLSDYYDKDTKIFTFPKGCVASSLMGQVFTEFLILLDLVEKVEE